MTPAQLSEALRAALVHAVDDGTFALDPAAIPATVHLERPRQREHGDWATNVAMQLAKKAGTNPRAFAEELARRLEATEGVATVEVAGPGFLNIRLDAASAGELARSIVELGTEYGTNETLAGVALNLEFVSANPTGPLHIGGVRWAAVGDSLARVLQASGATVAREYYFNDHGAQIDRFSRSLLARALGQPAPEDGYGGAVHQRDRRAGGGRRAGRGRARPAHAADRRGQRGVPCPRRRPDVRGDPPVAARLRRHFDVYFHEDSLHRSGAVEHAVARLREQGHIFEADGAIWLRTTTFGDDQRPRRSSGPTARPPTSRATSPTTWTSASAGSTASSSCSAPTTTGTSAA